MIQLSFPFRILIVGASNTGKSTLLADIVLNRDKIINKKIDKIWYCAKYQTSIPAALKTDPLVKFHQGVPSDEICENSEGKNVLIILDDLLETAFQSDTVSSIFTQGRNRSIATILVSQVLFPRYANARNVSLNASHIIYFRNIRDASSINCLARQICPLDSKAFSELFLNNINKPFSYLLMDFQPTTPDIFRYRENILSNRPTIFVDEKDLEKVAQKNETFNQVQAFTVEFPEFY